MFLSWLRMPSGLFQTAERIGGMLTEPQKITMQQIPKGVTIELMLATGKFQCQRPVPGTRQIFPQLLFVRCENTNPTPPARNGDIPLL